MNVNIGYVTHYYTHLGVAVIALNGEVALGDLLVFLGHTTDLTQPVCSIEVEHHRLTSAGKGLTVAIKVDEPVREGDQVFKIIEGAGDPQNHLIWRWMSQAIEAIYPTYQPVFSEFQHRNGLNEHAIGMLLAAITLEPGTISPERLLVRGPYTAETVYMTRLHHLAEKGFLVEPEPGEFRLSKSGRTKTEKLIAQVRAAMAQADPLSAEESHRMAKLHSLLVQASLFSPPPPDTWSIRLEYQLMPEEDPPLPYIEQALSCLSGYRDDSHLAAWQPSGLPAHSLEALTLLWRSDAGSVEHIYDHLGNRGYELHDYQAAIKELQQRGLVEGVDASLRLTPIGKDFRDQIERTTDRYFFTPWVCLEPAEKAELACLLSTLVKSLKAKVIP